MNGKQIIGVLLICGTIAAGVSTAWSTYYDQMQALAYLSRGITSGSAEEYAEYVEAALQILEPYEGTTAIVLGTATDDVSLFKQDLESNLMRAKSLDKDDPNYTHVLDDLTDRLIEFKNQLSEMNLFVARYGRTTFVGIVILAIILFIAGFVLAV